jgi:hypothetical protein
MELLVGEFTAQHTSRYNNNFYYYYYSHYYKQR